LISFAKSSILTELSLPVLRFFKVAFPDFISLSRIAYGEDIKQYFVAVTKSGMVFTTDDLKTWKSQGNISLK